MSEAHHRNPDGHAAGQRAAEFIEKSEDAQLLFI
jgi:hypothetical protein